MPYLSISPNPDWYRGRNDSPLRFPPLKYTRTSNSIIPNGRLVIGASWNVFHDQTPWFAARRAIFENLYFPYQFPGIYLKVRHAALLWPRINLSAYTLLSNPRYVYISDGQRYVAEFQFDNDCIRLTEFDENYPTSTEV
nr:hypothetical protein [Apis mellifera nudivirus]